MAKIVECKAKNKATCRFHGALEHAEMSLAVARLQYAEAEAEVAKFSAEELKPAKNHWGTTVIHPAKRNLNSKKIKLAKAFAEFDVFPENLARLEAQLIQLKADDKSLEAKNVRYRYKKAKELLEKRVYEEAKAKRESREEKKRLAEKKVLFEQIKKEVEDSKNSPNEDSSWRCGYKRAVSQAIIKNGAVVNGEGKSMYGSYYPDYNPELHTHLKTCGALDVRNIEEKAWEDWDYNSMASVQTSTTRYRVEAQVTCNCGDLTCQPIEMSGTFREVLDSVLKF